MLFRSAGAASTLDGITAPQSVPTLPGMEPVEEAIADLWATGISPDGHPTVFLRGELDARGVLTAEALGRAPHGQRVLVAGFLAGGNDEVDGNAETVRLLRSQLRNKSDLRVIDADALPLLQESGEKTTAGEKAAIKEHVAELKAQIESLDRGMARKEDAQRTYQKNVVEYQRRVDAVPRKVVAQSHRAVEAVRTARGHPRVREGRVVEVAQVLQARDGAIDRFGGEPCPPEACVHIADGV